MAAWHFHWQSEDHSMNSGTRSHFPIESIADLGGVADWAGQSLNRLCERPLHPVESQQALVVRLLCLPTGSPAFSVRAEAYGLSWRLFSRELSSDDGFERGELSRREDRLVVGADAEKLTDLWRDLRFWSIAAADDRDVIDGTTYVLEAAERGRYRVIYRDDPEWGDTFGEFSEVLLNLVGIVSR
jgi:hypothetical protein